MHSNLCGKGEEHSFSYYDNIWYHCFVDVIVSLIIHSQCNGGEGCELSSTFDAGWLLQANMLRGGEEEGAERGACHSCSRNRLRQTNSSSSSSSEMVVLSQKRLPLAPPLHCRVDDAVCSSPPI